MIMSETVVHGVFFDMDGVVIDSGPVWNRIIGKIREEYALDMSSLEKSDGYNLSSEEALSLVLNDMGRFSCSLLEDILSRIDSLYSSYIDHATLMPEMSKIFSMLNERGVEMMLVSNSSRKQVNMVMDRLGLRKYFCMAVTADDVSRGKPDPEPYCLAVKLSGLPSERIAAVEDSLTGAVSAVKAGLRCLAVSQDAFADIEDYSTGALGHPQTSFCERLDSFNPRRLTSTAPISGILSPRLSPFGTFDPPTETEIAAGICHVLPGRLYEKLDELTRLVK